jgi:sec-independent protein translocase protein TatA
MDLFAPNHIILILLIIVLLFGGKKIPELMRGLGKGMREFNDAKNNVKKDIDDGINDRDRQSTVPPATSTTTQP